MLGTYEDGGDEEQQRDGVSVDVRDGHDEPRAQPMYDLNEQ